MLYQFLGPNTAPSTNVLLHFPSLELKGWWTWTLGLPPRPTPRLPRKGSEVNT